MPLVLQSFRLYDKISHTTRTHLAQLPDQSIQKVQSSTGEQMIQPHLNARFVSQKLTGQNTTEAKMKFAAIALGIFAAAVTAAPAPAPDAAPAPAPEAEPIAYTCNGCHSGQMTCCTKAGVCYYYSC